MRKLLAIFAVLLFAALGAHAIEMRFAMPDFDTDYELPGIFTPEANVGFGVWDALILFGALSMATWLVLKKRSRRGLFLLSIASLAYFGFYRDGCVCPIGATQNVAAAVFIPDVGVSFLILSFFVMPLLFSLFFGRVFCAAVCPLGAIQELVAIRPVRIPTSIDRAFGLGRYIYLGTAILGVAMGAGFFICRYDPFVGIFRMTHNFGMLAAGGVILLLGVFVARPYCRFLCPYGVLLGWMSKFSKYHLDIPPSPCVQCRLCEESCPYNAIDMPTPTLNEEQQAAGFSRIRRYVYATPLIILAGAISGVMLSPLLAQLHPTVRLSERVAAEEKGLVQDQTVETEAFRKGGETIQDMYSEAMLTRDRFKTGGAWLGAFIGLVVALKLISLSVYHKRTVFEPNRATCYSCGRCYPYCPVEKGEDES